MNKKQLEQFRKSCQEELGYISSIFMSQGNIKAGDIIMPTEELNESADRFELYLFKALKAERQSIIEMCEKKIKKINFEDKQTRHDITYNQAILDIIKSLK